MKHFFILFLISLALLAVACSTPVVTSSPSHISTSSPIPTSTPTAISTNTPEPTSPPPNRILVKPDIGNVHILSCASTNCETVFIVDRDSEFDVLARNDKNWNPWYKVKIGDSQSGWIAVTARITAPEDLWERIEEIKSTITPIPSTPTSTKTPIPTQEVGICPIKVTKKQKASLAGHFSEYHKGIDIGGGYGTEHRSPHYCEVVTIGIERTRAHIANLHCPGLPSPYIHIGHIDLSFNDYDTLKWYGIPIRVFFFSDGRPKTGTYVKPEQNQWHNPGDDLKIYMGNTGYSSGVHSHISTGLRRYWGVEQIYVDPCLHLDCCR